ncbi:unnamed protein product [Ambrosiozyma monospora]|uniref:Unnamed protein product n=1 Tax=Ambrosiozyma monospora TaxID=43982 RepID=A0ACB5TE68_AMBMO|nr:unnamed protein product [Ambrosiozyma monospora]
MNLVDKNTGKPYLPEKFKGVPSATKFNYFLDNLILFDELKHVKPSLVGLDKINKGWLKPSTINSYLYKSFEFGHLDGGLKTVYTTLPNFRNSFNLKNIEALLLIRSLQIKQGGVTSLDWLYKKLKHVFKYNRANLKLKENYENLELYNIAYLQCLFQLKFNLDAAGTEADAKTVALLKKKIDRVTGELKDFETVKFNADDLKEGEDYLKNYLKYEHNYTVLTLFKQVVGQLSAEEQKAYKDVLDKSAAYFKFVDELKSKAGVKTGLVERLNAAAEKKVEAKEEEAPKAEESKE